MKNGTFYQSEAVAHLPYTVIHEKIENDVKYRVT